MNAEPVSYEARDGVAWITLNRPAVLNALDTELAAALADHVEAAAAAGDVALVIVRGRGRAFCSGMDRTALGEGTIGEPFFRHWIRALNGLEDMPKITVAVLHGYSIGGRPPPAAGHTKRLLQASFHGDPRALIEELIKAQNECMAWGEIAEATRAGGEKGEAVFSPPRGPRLEP